MNIRTITDLYDYTTDQLAWRKKELISLKMLVNPKMLMNQKKGLYRSLVCMVYAHLEGYIKSCSAAYINFVALQRLTNAELAPNFIALSLKTMLNECSKSKKVEDHLKLVNFFRDGNTQKTRLLYKSRIDTQSNLSSLVFKNIILSLGLDYSFFIDKEIFLDEIILSKRNHIAHGEDLDLSEIEINDIFQGCLEIMELFKNQIDNAAYQIKYKTT